MPALLFSPVLLFGTLEYSKVKNSKVEPFWPCYTVLEGFRSRKAKTTTTPQFFEKKESKEWFSMRKTNRNFVVQWNFEKLNFSYLTINKSGSSIVLSKFQILKTNFWLIFNKRFELMVHTFYFCVLRNSIFQTSEAL